MPAINKNDVLDFIASNIESFHIAKLGSLEKLQLRKVLRAKNPYLFKAKNVQTAHEIVKGILDAYLSSQEEAMFGEFLEGLAIFICGRVYGGRKSVAEGIDLEFENEGKLFLVVIKSGPNWGNSSQVKKMRLDFLHAKKIHRTNNPDSRTEAINGCCYGRDNKPDKGEYQKLCGQRFWEFISGNTDLFTTIIEPLGHKAKQKNDKFQKLYAQRINMFEAEFLKDFAPDGLIDWKKLVEFNSATVPIQLPKTIRGKRKANGETP